MTIIHGLQIALVVAVVVLVVERVRVLAYRAPLDAPAMRKALMRLLRAGEHERAEALVNAARPAWVAEVVWPLVDPDREDEQRGYELDDQLLQIRADAEKGLHALRVMGTVGSALGFMGAAHQLWWIFHGDHGLLRLQAGLVENMGLNRAVLHIALGITASSLALGSWMVLRKLARRLIVDARRVAGSVEELLFPLPRARGE